MAGLIIALFVVSIVGFFLILKAENHDRKYEITTMYEKNKEIFTQKYNPNPNLFLMAANYSKFLTIDEAEGEIIISENFFDTANTTNDYTIKFDDIHAVEKYIDGNAEMRTSRSNQFVSAAVGAVLFGGAGAVIGALTATKKQGKVHYMSLRIIKNDINDPIHEILFFNNEHGLDRDHPLSVQADYLLNDWIHKFNIIIKKCDNQKIQKNSNADDIYTQIKKLHDLKENGIITDDEFNSKKTSLLK